MASHSAHLPRLGQHLVRSVGCLAAVSRVFADGDGVTTVKYRYESYDEADNRVDVLSHMMDLRHETAGGTALGVRYALDSLSGATPVGTYERSDPSVWKFAEIEDERRSIGLTIEQKIDDYGKITYTFDKALNKAKEKEDKKKAKEGTEDDDIQDVINEKDKKGKKGKKKKP